jgi:hypothetical protein
MDRSISMYTKKFFVNKDGLQTKQSTVLIPDNTATAVLPPPTVLIPGIEAAAVVSPRHRPGMSSQDFCFGSVASLLAARVNSGAVESDWRGK